MYKKRAQAWGFDLMIASSIFIFGIITFYTYTLNYPSETESTINSLTYDGNLIASTLLSEGYPKSWDNTNVASIGLLSENKVNETKLENFKNIEYSKTKALFNTKYEYFVNISNDENSQYIGIDPSPIDPNNLIKISRYTIYENKPATLTVYIYN